MVSKIVPHLNCGFEQYFLNFKIKLILKHIRRYFAYAQTIEKPILPEHYLSQSEYYISATQKIYYISATCLVAQI